MDLRSLPVRFPVCQAFVDQLLSVLVDLAIDLDDLHALPLCTVNLSPHSFIIFLRLDLRGVESLFRNGADGAPPQLMCQDALAYMVHAPPDGFELFLALDVVKVRPDHLRHLFGIT